LSAREGQRQLLKILPQAALPMERERVVSYDHTEIKFSIDENLRQKLEEIRSLLGARGANCSYAELFSHMAEISLRQLKGKAFGKKRVEAHSPQTPPSQPKSQPTSTPPTLAAGGKIESAKTHRYISAKVKHAVWSRDRGQCSQCQSLRNLNLDHIMPVAMQGPTTVENLRLLCFQCNQRAAIKKFGLNFMTEKS
jgi:hypothetical protein